jgi:hypothetical protein
MKDPQVVRTTDRKWRGVGLRLHVPKGKGIAHAALGLAELFVETGEGFDAKWDNLLVDFSPDGTVVVTVKFFPQKIEIEELPQ